jgi:hypothetical protein
MQLTNIKELILGGLVKIYHIGEIRKPTMRNEY